MNIDTAAADTANVISYPSAPQAPTLEELAEENRRLRQILDVLAKARVGKGALVELYETQTAHRHACGVVICRADVDEVAFGRSVERSIEALARAVAGPDMKVDFASARRVGVTAHDAPPPPMPQAAPQAPMVPPLVVAAVREAGLNLSVERHERYVLDGAPAPQTCFSARVIALTPWVVDETWGAETLREAVLGALLGYERRQPRQDGRVPEPLGPVPSLRERARALRERVAALWPEETSPGA